MQIFGLFSVFAYCVVSLIVGTRLIRLARRTHELPELLIGGAFLSGGMVGYPFVVAAHILGGSTGPVRVVFAVSALGLAVSAWCILMTWWRIYHPTRRWGPWVVSLWTALLGVTLLERVWTPDPARATAADPWYAFMLIVQGGVYAANAWSGLRYHALLRRRLRLGLADPVVANRIWLWAVAALAITIQYGYALAIPSLNALFDAVHAQPAFTGALGLFAAATITLAFHPPRAYVERVERRATGQAA